jgi:hypothetical protein
VRYFLIVLTGTIKVLGTVDARYKNEDYYKSHSTNKNIFLLSYSRALIYNENTIVSP